MAERTVQCSKYDQELPGLDAPPFDGELGEAIYRSVSRKAWSEWHDDMMIKVINEYRLNLADAEHYDVLLQQMKAFLNLDDSVGVLEVENADRGKS
ncbi:MAG: oxidative damage protection protein [Bdellovibrionales bacterium]|nr:oxidative damage protection protein [Bdellovibrionales bacterium]MCB0359992.1 oxidative damage protection protein [Bdellovibrionales bacterium]